MPNVLKIGVFDSGIGGLSVARAIERALPDAEVLFIHDSLEHFPYATKSPDEIYGFITPIFQDFLDQKCDAVVVACNTVSTTLISRLRKQFAAIPMVALEPMVKPAAEQTKSGIIAVCATPTTLVSPRYQWLKETYAVGLTILEPDCADWSYLIESSQINEERISKEIRPVLEQGADVIVLGCTHYHWIEQQVKAIASARAKVIQPETAVVRQLKRVLELPA